MRSFIFSNIEACNFTKNDTYPWVFFTFLSSTNGTKSRKASHIFKFKVVVAVSPLIHLNVQTSQTSVYKACKREKEALSFTGKFISKKKLKLHWRRVYNFTSISCESEMWYTMNLCDEFQHWSENTVPYYPLIYIGCYSIPQKFNPTSWLLYFLLKWSNVFLLDPRGVLRTMPNI